MYNEELKTKFIKEYTQSINTAKVAVSVFNSLSSYEEGWRADLCTRSAEELHPVISRVLALRARSQGVSMSILREYVRWCIVNSVPGACDGMLHVAAIGLEKVRRQMVSNPLHLRKCLDEVFKLDKGDTIDVVYRCYYWLVYSGLREVDTLLVTASDICFAEQCIKFNGKTYPLYRESLSDFHKAVELKEFFYEHQNPSYTIMRPRVEGDTIMRGVRADTKLVTIRSVLSKKMSKAEEKGEIAVNLTYFRVWLSGLFYRVYEQERAGIEVDFSGVAAERMEGKAYRIAGVNKRIKVSHIQNQKAADYKEDYERWKLAFAI